MVTIFKTSGSFRPTCTHKACSSKVQYKPSKDIQYKVFAPLRYYATLIGSYRRFGTTYRVGYLETLASTNQRCVTSLKIEDLIYVAPEAWNHNVENTDEAGYDISLCDT
jgi:hypothetical protein